MTSNALIIITLALLLSFACATGCAYMTHKALKRFKAAKAALHDALAFIDGQYHNWNQVSTWRNLPVDGHILIDSMEMKRHELATKISELN